MESSSLVPNRIHTLQLSSHINPSLMYRFIAYSTGKGGEGRGGREGGREGWWGGRDGGREGQREEEGREGGNEGWREGGSE